MKMTLFICVAGLVGILFGISIRMFPGASATESTSESHLINAAAGSLLPQISESDRKDAGSSRRLELETIFAQKICDGESVERVVALIRDWGEEDVIGLFRWWRNHDFRFLTATIPDTYYFLLRKLAETDQDFAWRIAESLKFDPSRFGDLAREIARVKGKKGDADEFRQFLDKINATVRWEGIERFGYGKMGFYSLFAAVNPNEALSLVQEIRSPAERIAAITSMSALTLDEIVAELADGSVKDAAVRSLAYSAKNGGDLELAMKALSEITDPHSRRQTAEVMAKQLLDDSELQGFERLYERFELAADPEIKVSAEAVTLLSAHDFDGITRLLEDSPSSKITSTIKRIVSRSLAEQDLEGALNWLGSTATAGLEKDESLIRSAISAAMKDGDPVSMVGRVAQSFPELLPLTDWLINMISDVKAAESVFELIPLGHRERIISHWLDRYGAGLTSEQVARMESYIESGR